MSQLELYENKQVAFSAGSCVALCNHPTTQMSAELIKAARVEPIDKAVFIDCLALYHERFDKEPKKSLLNYYFGEYTFRMGHSEFLAAFRDLMAADVFFAAGWAYVFEHVKKQRRDGPDLISLGMAEAYKRGSE